MLPIQSVVQSIPTHNCFTLGLKNDQGANTWARHSQTICETQYRLQIWATSILRWYARYDSL